MFNEKGEVMWCITRGRGVGKFQRVIWLLSAPVRAEINETIQRLTGTSYETSEQHLRRFSVHE